MLRITTIEQGAEQEVYDVRFFSGIVLYPALLVMILGVGGWAAAGDLRGEGGVTAIAMLLLASLIGWLAAKAWQRVRITVRPDLITIDPGSVGLFSNVWCSRSTSIGQDESMTLGSYTKRERRKSQHGSWTETVTRYRISTSRSDQAVVSGLTRHGQADRLSTVLNAALARLQDLEDADPFGPGPDVIDS